MNTSLIFVLVVGNTFFGVMPLSFATVASGSVLASRVYTGSLLGVRARVELHEDDGFATLTLRGLPVGGTLTGQARFASDGGVVVSDKLETALRRRYCSVEEVNEEDGQLHVHLNLPVFGRRIMRLDQVDAFGDKLHSTQQITSGGHDSHI